MKFTKKETVCRIVHEDVATSFTVDTSTLPDGLFRDRVELRLQTGRVAEFFRDSARKLRVGCGESVRLERVTENVIPYLREGKAGEPLTFVSGSDEVHTFVESLIKCLAKRTAAKLGITRDEFDREARTPRTLPFDIADFPEFHNIHKPREARDEFADLPPS